MKKVITVYLTQQKFGDTWKNLMKTYTPGVAERHIAVLREDNKGTDYRLEVISEPHPVYNLFN
jgi:hypothetical protein